MRIWKLSKKKVQVLALMRGESLVDVAKNAGFETPGYIYRAVGGGDVMLSTVSRIASALEVSDPCELLEASDAEPDQERT